MFTTLLYFLTALYLLVTGKELYRLFHPPACKGQGCWHAMLPLRSRIDMTAFVGDGSSYPGVHVWNATNVSSIDELEDRMIIPVPPGIRRGELRELWLVVHLARAGHDEVIAAARVNLVTMYKPRERSEAALLLERDVLAQTKASDANANAVAEVVSDVSTGLAPADQNGAVPHYIYSSRHCELRLVTDATPHGPFHSRGPYLEPDGEPIGQSWDVHRRTYTPHFYVDRFSLLRKHSAPLASSLDKPHP